LATRGKKKDEKEGQQGPQDQLSTHGEMPFVSPAIFYDFLKKSAVGLLLHAHFPVTGSCWADPA
jgi:hypothetical protein